MLAGFITALRTLTIIPVPGKDAERFSSALYWFTWIGFLLGGFLFFVAMAALQIGQSKWPEGVAILVLGMSILLTRGFHLDGLADFADGFWGGHDRERTLAIMKDSFLGTFGVVSIIFILLAKWIALVRLIEIQGEIWIIAAYVVSRFILVELTVCLPYARKSGTAGAFVQEAGNRHRIVAMATSACLMFLLLGLIGLLTFALGWMFCRIFGWWCMKRVGGITGDLLGACCEATETMVLFLAVYLTKLFPTWPFHFKLIDFIA